MKKNICDKCKKEIFENERLFNEYGYDLCSGCYDKLLKIINKFFGREIIGDWSVPKSMKKN
jgi:hypothetical protein